MVIRFHGQVLEALDIKDLEKTHRLLLKWPQETAERRQ